MANPWFRFKQFKISQDNSAFRVGTDGVLLGAWADLSGVRNVLDVGCGTGLLALMMAQRSNAGITAIEIDQSSFEEAKENVKASPWPERIKVFHCSLQEYEPCEKFDMIISNPPFFKDSMLPGDKGRIVSRHDSMLSFEELAGISSRLLTDEGRLCLVLPVVESQHMEIICKALGLYLHRVMSVKPTPSMPVKRKLSEFRFYPAETIIMDELIIEKGPRHDYTDEYKALTGDFYLAF